MKTKYFIIIGLFMITFISCDEDFLERLPLTQPASATFYTDEKAAIMGVTGVYNSLQYGSGLRDWEDCLTDNERWNTDGSSALYGGLAHGLETPLGNNGYAIRWWGMGYIMIQKANSAIDNIGKMTNVNTTLKNRLIAECKVIRGLAYHQLVWRFGDVPLLLDPVATQEFTPARAPKADIVNQIYADFTDAAQYLPVTYTGADIGRITKGAALGLLAKEYLFNGEWAKAATEAKKVMDTPEYGLISSYLDLYKPGNFNTKEGLLEVQWWTSKGEFSSGFYNRWLKGTAANTGASGNGWCFVVQNLVNAFENSDGTPFDPAGRDLTTDNTQYANRDPRLKYAIFVDGMDYFGQTFKRSWSETTYAWRKFTISKTDPLYVTNANAPFDWYLLRFADVLLIYAEAKNEAEGATADVYNAVNKVRTRAGMPDLPAGLSKDAMRERIYNERRVELCGEGTRFEDLVRWRRLKGALESKHLNQGVNYQINNWEEFRYLWPVPQTEINVNPKLVQNPGY